MKKSFKKILAGTTAGMFALTATIGLNGSLPVKAAQDTSSLEDGTAYLNINNADWADFEAEYTNVKITGDGSYTVAMKAKEGQSLVQFNALEVVNGESALGTACVITVDSIKINGEDVELAGPSYTCSADCGAVTTRVNLYNEWNAPTDEDGNSPLVGEDNHPDSRMASGELKDAKACLFDASYCDASSGSGFKVESMEVNFTVSNYGVMAEGVSVTAEPEKMEGTAKGHLNINTPDWSGFDADYEDVEITADGDYSVSMIAKAPIALGAFNALEFENGELMMGTATIVTVTAIEINGEKIGLEGEGYTCSADGAGKTTRVNLYNEYNDPDATATAGNDKHIDQRCAGGDVTACTARMIPASYTNGYEVTSIKVDFTVSNFGVWAEGGAAVEKEIPTEFTAFLMFADGTNWENFNMGVGNEVTLKGDGVYEVSLTAEQCGAAGKAVPVADSFVFLVDIDGLGLAMEAAGTLRENADEKLVDTDATVEVAVFIDGQKVATKSKNIVTGDIEVNGRFRIDLVNAFDGSGTKENPVCNLDDLTPEKEVKVVFALKGTGVGEAAEVDLNKYLEENGLVEATTEAATEATTAAATEATTEAAKAESGKSNTTMIIIIIVAAVVVIGGVAGGVVAAKKKKGQQ